MLFAFASRAPRPASLMFIELVDHLRCIAPHEDIWLVANATRTDHRDILDGLLGCPICRAEYPIRDGVAYFAEPERRAGGVAPSEEEAMRLAAFLDLADPRGFAALVGDNAVHADILQGLTDVHLVLINAPDAAVTSGASGIVTREVLPLAPGTLRGIAFDQSVTPEQASRWVAAVRGKGRVVGPTSLGVPRGVTELVRDNRVWVGEREVAPSGLVGLRRA